MRKCNGFFNASKTRFLNGYLYGMLVDTVFKRLKFRASKSGYTGSISSADFNLMFPAAELRYYLKMFGNQNEYQYGSPIPRIAYPETLKISTSLAPFGSNPQVIPISSLGQYTKPSDLFFIDSISHIVTIPGGQINGSVNPGTGYVNGTYQDVPFTNQVGTGTGAKGTVVVAANIVQSVTVTTNGSGYKLNDILTASNTNLGGTGTGFNFTIQSIGPDPTPIERVEKESLNDWLISYYQKPTEMFPIYVEYNSYLQFYPIDLQYATLTYLKRPSATVWGSTLNGTIASTNTLVGGASYINGFYPNVALTGGAGNGAFADITVGGGAVTIVTIKNGGFVYKSGDILSASNTNLGGAGSGFSVTVASISNVREVYDAISSTDSQFSDYDIDQIIYMCLTDMGVFFKDNELENYAAVNTKTGGI